MNCAAFETLEVGVGGDEDGGEDTVCCVIGRWHEIRSGSDMLKVSVHNFCLCFRFLLLGLGLWSCDRLNRMRRA